MLSWKKLDRSPWWTRVFFFLCVFVVVFLGMYDDWIAFGPIAQLEIAQDKNSHYRNERERQTRGWGGSGGRGGGVEWRGRESAWERLASGCPALETWPDTLSFRAASLKIKKKECFCGEQTEAWDCARMHIHLTCLWDASACTRTHTNTRIRFLALSGAPIRSYPHLPDVSSCNHPSQAVPEWASSGPFYLFIYLFWCPNTVCSEWFFFWLGLYVPLGSKVSRLAHRLSAQYGWRWFPGTVPGRCNLPNAAPDSFCSDSLLPVKGYIWTGLPVLARKVK